MPIFTAFYKLKDTPIQEVFVLIFYAERQRRHTIKL